MMISFKGILKYLVYICIAGWMFLLGIMVGRGTSPVTFDTHKFQKRLEIIANEFGSKTKTREKIDLKFYDVLDDPVAEEEGASPEKKSLEIIPKKEEMVTAENIPLKTSRKKQTFKHQGNTTGTESLIQQTLKADTPAPDEIKTKPAVLEKGKTPEPVMDKAISKGNFTIQVAAYKDFKDAITQMAILEKKGFASYRVKAQKDGVTWYRIRTGSFAIYDDAKKYLEKLNQANIKAMIIKRDDNEDIKG
ncbi:MAG: SPOR domain-containing protein [Pseudomonadota bacterium]